VDDVSRAQTPCPCDRSFADAHRSVRVALFLDGRATGAPNSPGDSTAELKVVVRSVYDRVDLLLCQIAGDDQNSRLTRCQTSATLCCRSFSVALAMPRTPIASIVSDAHATPHTIAS
jgi:hypothetical protein